MQYFELKRQVTIFKGKIFLQKNTKKYAFHKNPLVSY